MADHQMIYISLSILGSPTFVTNPGGGVGKPGVGSPGTLLGGAAAASSACTSIGAAGLLASEAGVGGSSSSTQQQQQYSHFGGVNMGGGYQQASVHGPAPPLPGVGAGQPPPIMARHNRK